MRRFRTLRPAMAVLFVVALALVDGSASLAADADYALGFYIDPGGTNNVITFTYVNNTGQLITNLSGQFDLEVPWVRYAHAEVATLPLFYGGFNNGFRYAVTTGGANLTSAGWPNLSGILWGKPLVSGLVLTNANVRDGYQRRWLDDAEMDGRYLSMRRKTFSIPGINLRPGGQVTFAWFADGAYSQTFRTLLQTVDDFLLVATIGGSEVVLYKQDFDAIGRQARAAVGEGGLYPAPAGWRLLVNNVERTGGVKVAGAGVSGSENIAYYATDAIPDIAGPITSRVAVAPNPVPVGAQVALSARVDDTATGGAAVASAEYRLAEGAWVAMAASDGAYGGVAENVEASFPAAQVGRYRVCVRGRDVRGNRGAETCTTLDVHYLFQGFYVPIYMDMDNAANAGQAIPVKWRLTAAGGEPVADPASFAGIYSQQVNCADPAVALSGAVKELAPGASGLQYQGDGRWQYNWKTAKAYTGTCRVMRVVFHSGQTSPAVLFRFARQRLLLGPARP